MTTPSINSIPSLNIGVPSMNIAGHRGLPAHYPENTLLGIKAALAAGAQGVEIDVQFTKDGEPVVLHDAELKRVTGLSGHVAAFELALLTKMSAHEPERFGSQFLPTPITPLHQLITVMPHYPQALLFVELKEQIFDCISREQAIAKLAQVLAPIATQCVIIAYDIAVLRLLRQSLDWPIGWILNAYSEANLLLAQGLQPDYLLCDHHKLPSNNQPLWLGLWQWFIYDITEYNALVALNLRGVSWVESWDAAALIAEVKAATP